ncbi:MAG: hypothetical protein AB9903_03870 [Vulcanimicrobiota bacterium]
MAVFTRETAPRASEDADEIALAVAVQIASSGLRDIRRKDAHRQ